MGSATTNQPDPVAGPLEYRRGWLVDEAPLPASLHAWSSVPLGTSHRLSFHPAANVVSFVSEGAQVVLCGLPVDLKAESIDPAAIAGKVASLLRGEGGGDSAAARYLAYLGGRFVCFLAQVNDDSFTVFTDCAATMPAYWSKRGDGGIVVSSHASLCASISGQSTDAGATGLIKLAREMNTPGTLFPPGVMTGYSAVKQVLANHSLKVNASVARHYRYYPFADSQLPNDPKDSFDRFVDAFRMHTKLLISLGPVGISLTGGRDSRATLAAAFPHLDQRARAWTYLNSENPHPEHLADAEVAKSLAQRSGLAYQVVDLGASPDVAFERACRKSMGVTAQMLRVPMAYNAQLPGDLIELQSMAAEIGTGFYKNRSGRPEVPRLAELYARGDFSRLPAVRDQLEEFIEYADFHEERMHGVDFHDLFYWEHRLGRWGSRRIQEVDLAHRVVLPFNSRAIVESLMAKPIEYRYDKRDLVRFVEEAAPELAG